MPKRRIIHYIVSHVLLITISIAWLLPSDQAAAVENGDTVVPPETPSWAVYIGIPRGFLNPFDTDGFLNPWSGEQQCSGSLIERGWVLTAAHCVVSPQVDEAPTWVKNPNSINLSPTVTDKGKLRAVIGRGRLDSNSEGQESDIADIVFHPKFRMTGRLTGGEFPCKTYANTTCRKVEFLNDYSYDVALLKLSKPVPNGTKTIRLSTQAVAPGTKTQLYGYGFINDARDITRELRKTRAGSYTAMADCEFRKSEQFCTQRVADSLVRKGDSGGAWVEEGSDLQIGVEHGGPADGSRERATSLHAIIDWLRTTANLPTPGATDSNSIAMALVIDSSGSMTSNDPSNRRIEAGRAYLNAAGASDAVGVVDFDSGSRIASEAINPRTGKEQLLTALNSIDSAGGTNIGAGVQSACDLLGRSGPQPAKAAILLTDGDGSYSGQHSCFKSKGWKLYTFGLGSSVNSSLLTNIAQETGGKYKSLPSPENLICEFQQIRAAVAGVSNGSCDPPELIKLKQLLLKSINVPPRQLQTVFSVGWPGSDIDMTIISPSGRRITVNTDAYDVTADSGATFETITVYRPEPGEWKIELLGVDVDEGGEPIVFSTTQVPLANQVPRAVVGEPTLLDRGTGTFRFSANGSTDSDGRIIDYLWDFGDGLADSGETVEHRFAKPGTYTVRLTVVDDDLETATIERQMEVPAFLTPVAFTLAGHAGQSALYATGSPKNGVTEGSVFGLLRNQPMLSTPITAAGMTTIDGNEVLLVRFKVGDAQWELRYRNLFFGIGSVEICGPPGCETGTGIKLDSAGMPLSAFAPFGINIPDPGATTTTSTSTTTTTVGSTTTTITPTATTSTTTPVESTTSTTSASVTTTSGAAISASCAQLKRQLDRTSDPRVMAQILASMRTFGCPA